MFGPQDIVRLANRDFILGNTTVEEQVSFIKDQICDPFESGDTNYFNKLADMVTDKDELDDYCEEFFTAIQDVYPGLWIETSEYNQHLGRLFKAVYKFFIKNVGKLMYVFIKEFIFNNKNRKGLIAEFSNVKIPNYPKEQYGKKEFYILIIKLSAIVDEIFDDGVKLKKFIEYIEKSDKSPVYVDQISEALEVGLVVDNGVVSDMYKLFKKSDGYRSAMNKLEMEITKTFIIPYLEENGMMSVRIPPTEEIPDDLDDEEDESDG